MWLVKVTQGTKTNKMAEGEESEVVAISVTLETKFSDEKKRELIKELEKNPCLWETGCPSYVNRVQRQKVTDTVSAKFNVDPSALKSTIHGLRTSLIREMKREKEGKKSKWRFYEALSFMKEDIERSLKAKESQEWSPEDNEKMLDFYRDHDQLWNHHLESYRDRNLRDMNMKSLTEMFPERSEVEIKKQWQTLRTIFFREMKREEGSKSSGSGTDTVYTSPWKHFKSMMFLKGNDEIDPQVSTLQCETVDTENEKPAKRARTTRRQHETPAKEIEDAKLQLYREAIKCLQSPFPVTSGSLQSSPNDDITVFLKNIEVTLRKLPGRQLALAKRKIYGLVSDLEVQLYNSPQPPMSSSTVVTANATPFSDATNMSWNYSSDHQYYY